MAVVDGRGAGAEVDNTENTAVGRLQIRLDGRALIHWSAVAARA